MTGYYVRTINGDSIEIENLTPEQFDELIKNQPDKGWAWAKALAEWIKQNVSSVTTTPSQN